MSFIIDTGALERTVKWFRVSDQQVSGWLIDWFGKNLCFQEEYTVTTAKKKRLFYLVLLEMFKQCVVIWIYSHNSGKSDLVLVGTCAIHIVSLNVAPVLGEGGFGFYVFNHLFPENILSSSCGKAQHIFSYNKLCLFYSY